MTGPAGPRPYDPVPDLARLLRVLEWSAPIGDAPPGSAAEVCQQIRQGLGVPSGQNALEYEKLLYDQLALLSGWKPGRHQQQEQHFTTNMDGVTECKVCRQPMIDGVIAHKLDCRGMWNDSPRSAE